MEECGKRQAREGMSEVENIVQSVSTFSISTDQFFRLKMLELVIDHQQQSGLHGAVPVLGRVSIKLCLEDVYGRGGDAIGRECACPS